MNINDFIVQVALPEHRVFAEEICEEMAESAKHEVQVSLNALLIM